LEKELYTGQGNTMEKIIAELKQIIDFKDTTVIGDIVLIAAREPEMFIYAYVIDIKKDTTRKDEWWHLQLKILSIPPQKMTWTLRTQQMTGQEIFTMGGEERFIKAINLDRDVTSPILPAVGSQAGKKGLRRVK
jgi:hypothetical protein